MRNYKKIILDNGIPLYLYNDPSMKRVFCGYTVKYGLDGKYTDFELDGEKHHVRFGVAHFLEHLLCEHSKYGNVCKKIIKRQSISNAYTASDHTTYFFTGSKEVKDSIKEIIETVDTPVFTSDDIEQSRPAVEEEATGYLDDSRYIAMGLTEKNLYASYDKYDDSLSSIGDRENNHEITEEELRTCYDAFYTDDKKVLVIAGNVDENELVDYLNGIYAKIPKHKSNLILPKYDLEPIRKTEDFLTRDVAVDFTALGIKIKKPEGVTPRDFQFVTSLYNYYMFDDQGEFMDYVRQNDLADSVHNCFFRGVGEYTNHFHSITSSKPEEYLKALFDKLNKKDITKEDFELIKKTFIAEEVRALDDKYDAPEDFGYRMEYSTDYSQADYYRTKTYDEFRSILDKLDFDKHTKVKVKAK